MDHGGNTDGSSNQYGNLPSGFFFKKIIEKVSALPVLRINIVPWNFDLIRMNVKHECQKSWINTAHTQL